LAAEFLFEEPEAAECFVEEPEAAELFVEVKADPLELVEDEAAVEELFLEAASFLELFLGAASFLEAESAGGEEGRRAKARERHHPGSRAATGTDASTSKRVCGWPARKASTSSQSNTEVGSERSRLRRTKKKRKREVLMP